MYLYNIMTSLSGEYLNKTTATNVHNANGTSTCFLVVDLVDPTGSSQNFPPVFRNTTTAGATLQRKPWLLYEKASGTLFLTDSATSGSGITGTPALAGQIALLTMKVKTGTNNVCLSHNATACTPYTATLDVTTTNGTFRLGQVLAGGLTMNYYEMVFYNGVLTDAEIEKVEGRLYWKHKRAIEGGALAWTLPNGHAYKTQPPRV